MDKRANWCAKKQNVSYVNEAFFEKWSNDMAYVLGFFTADGCLTKNAKRQNYYIEFVSIDQKIIEKIKSVMKAEQRITKRKINSKQKKAYRIQIGSKKLFNDLINLGFTPRKSVNMRFPAVSKKYLSHFIRGYFDGDGCISWGRYKRNNRPSPSESIGIRFTSGSRVFLSQLRKSIIDALDTNDGTLYAKKRGFELTFSTLDTLKILRYIYQRDDCIYLDRKHDKSMLILASRGAVA